MEVCVDTLTPTPHEASLEGEALEWRGGDAQTKTSWDTPEAVYEVVGGA